MKILVILFILIASFLMPQESKAAVYSVNTTNAEEIEINALLAAFNAARQAETPPRSEITRLQYIRGIFRENLQTQVDISRENSRRELRNAWRSANATTRNSIRSLLGLPDE